MERRLAAVLVAGICDYSRLMGEDVFGDGINVAARLEAALQELFRREPDNSYSLKEARRMYADTSGTRRYFDGLRLAGLPE